MEEDVPADTRPNSAPLPSFVFPSPWREGVYQAIYLRRDIRRFRPDPVPPDVLARVLDAAHHAPLVGFMQPWNFIVVADRRTRRQVQDLFERERLAAAQFFDEPRRAQYLSFKLEGILDAPLNLCVTCDPTRAGPSPLAAFVVGFLAERGWDRQLWRAAAAMLLGEVVIYAIGLPRLAFYVGIERAIPLGLLPFMPGDTLKLLLAAAVLPSGRRFLSANG